MGKTLSKNFMVIAALIMLTACASKQGVNDPIEPFNRAVFSFNTTLDDYILKPVAKGYSTTVPDFAQQGVGNFFSNLKYPVVCANQFLQGKFKIGMQDTTRFLVNSTFGVAGLFDVAQKFGLEEHDEDFGQTFGVWGMQSGPYIMLPLFGPSNIRDGLGMVAHAHVEPYNSDYFKYRRGTENKMKVLNLIDTRASLLKAERLVSGDKYVFLRDAYMQRRESLIVDGATSEGDPFLDDE
tara:strand:+ start:270832 stop:271545 length:714 start_codon:yes stop_codon:yes gene_type:complete